LKVFRFLQNHSNLKPVCWKSQDLTCHPNHLEFRHFQPFLAHFGPLVGYFEPFQHWVALKLVQHCLMVRLMVARLVMVDFLQEFVLRDVQIVVECCFVIGS